MVLGVEVEKPEGKWETIIEDVLDALGEEGLPTELVVRE